MTLGKEFHHPFHVLQRVYLSLVGSKGSDADVQRGEERGQRGTIAGIKLGNLGEVQFPRSVKSNGIAYAFQHVGIVLE